MRILIIDKIIKELSFLQEATLFGIQEKETIIISSLSKSLGLKIVGSFQPQKPDRNNQTNKQGIFFHFENNKLQCSCIESGKLTATQFEAVNYRTDFNNRNKGIIDDAILHETTVTIIGLGSGGSLIANELVRCGVTKLKFIEYDTISISNLCRTIYNLSDIGMKKTDVIIEKLLKINPCLSIDVYNEDVCKMDFEKLNEILKSSDLIIEATDSPKTKILINGLTHKSRPVLYPAVYEFGKGGDILLTIPGLPCYECVFKPIMDEMSESKKPDWDYSTGQAKPMPALISDIQIVVSRTVKIALSVLMFGTKHSFFEKITETGCTFLQICNEKNPQFSDKTFHEEWLKTQIIPDCMCQTLS